MPFKSLGDGTHLCTCHICGAEATSDCRWNGPRKWVTSRDRSKIAHRVLDADLDFCPKCAKKMKSFTKQDIIEILRSALDERVMPPKPKPTLEFSGKTLKSLRKRIGVSQPVLYGDADINACHAGLVERGSLILEEDQVSSLRLALRDHFIDRLTELEQMKPEVEAFCG